MFTKVQATHIVLIIIASLMLMYPQTGATHCDMINGPVVTVAKKALDQREISPILKWIASEDEVEVEEALQKTLAVRSLNGQAQELADQFFFETVVRLHRITENAPYTGLKPADYKVPESIQLADHSLEVNSVEPVLNLIQNAVQDGITERFERVAKLKDHADHHAQAGREYVKAYVEYVHYVLGLYQQTQTSAHPAHDETDDNHTSASKNDIHAH